MKRSSSDIESSPAPPSPSPNQSSTSTPTKKAKNSPPKQDGKKRSPSAAGGPWTADMREAVIERVLAVGLKGISVAALAEEFGMTKLQMANAMQAGRRGNLRDKVTKAARGA